MPKTLSTMEMQDLAAILESLDEGGPGPQHGVIGLGTGEIPALNENGDIVGWVVHQTDKGWAFSATSTVQ